MSDPHVPAGNVMDASGVARGAGPAQGSCVASQGGSVAADPASDAFVLNDAFMDRAGHLDEHSVPSGGVLPPGHAGGMPPSGEDGRPAKETGVSGIPAALFDTGGDEELNRLRSLIFGREIELLRQIQAKLDDPQYNAKKFGNIVSEAIVLRAGKDKSLNTALTPVVDEILQASLKRRQRDFVNVLFPLMGPSIRKSIAESFRSMLESFSKSVEMAFSWRGLKWRLQAMRAGKSFSEIVMLNTLEYRVEQIFFIHSDTGLVLAHLINEGAGAQDADMVSAMLTAIQDFVRDCFASGSEGELESLRMGEFTILIEKSPQAYLACVVRGTPPAGFLEQLRVSLELMLVEYADELTRFTGDTAPFAGATRFLDACMLTHYKDEDRELPLWAKALPVLLIIALVAGYGYYRHDQSKKEALALAEQNRLMERAKTYRDTRHSALSLLRIEPGLVITTVTEREEGPWEVIAFKDELARDPHTILSEENLASDLFTFKLVPFISYDHSIIVRRAQQAVALPESVRMELDNDDVLHFSGTASMDWIEKTRITARSLPGVKQVDMSQLRDPRMEEITALIRVVEDTVVEFPVGKDTPIPADKDKLTRAVDALVTLERLAKNMGASLSLTIYGHADHLGLEKRNYEISQARTRTVAAMLYARGSSIPISMFGMGSQYPREGTEQTEGSSKKVLSGDQASRRIEMRVHLMHIPTGASGGKTP